MKVYVCEEPRTIAVVSETHSLTFRLLSSGSETKAAPVSVQLEPNANISGKYKILINREAHGCLGLINIGGATYLAVITGAVTNVAHPVPYESVDKIYAVEFVSLASSDWDYVNLDSNGMPVQTTADPEDFDPNLPRVPHPCFELKKLLSNGSFYYSNDFDLTLLLQNRGIDKLKYDAKRPEDALVDLQHYQEQYMWNLFLMEELVRFRGNMDRFGVEILNRNRFLTTVIRGFAKTVPIGKDSITIISKQSWKRAGTRFNARGIDDDGNVANFVETEFIYNSVSLQQVFLFTQIRGSVPAFWEQDLTLINPKITITRSRGATQTAFDKHFDKISLRYGVCHIVNLLSKTKLQEVEVLRCYEALLEHSDHRTDLSYSAFDFHAETKQSGFSGASKILPQLYNSLEQFGWYNFDVAQGEVVTRQDGVFRVNCLDCLDRTNLVEQVICHCVVEHIVRNMSLRMLAEITAKHNVLWADNGDAILQIYTGTNALKLSFSRSGKMNFAGALSDVTKSVSRMYQNTFVDSKKQSTIDLLLGKDRQSANVLIHDPIREYVAEKLRGVESQYTSHSNILVFVGTFNVNAASPTPATDLSAWLFPPENESFPDIYALGLQELIELNAGSILTADASKPGQWAAIIEKQLNSRSEQYLLLRTEAIASMSVFLFVKHSCVPHVTQVFGLSKKTGLGGMTANKGACAVRFEYGATSFALVTSHLAAGVTATVERHNDYTSIMLGLTFTRNYTIGDHENVVWFGDLNYRLGLANDRCRRLIDAGAFDELIAVDQLTQEMQQSGGAFQGFCEEPIKFFPTYKYDKGTSNYDTLEKQRVPSWTDRILYRTSSDSMHQVNYNAVQGITASDHKPVYGTFLTRVRFIDEAKKHALSKQYYLAYKAQHGDDTLVDVNNGSDTSGSLTLAGSSFSSDTLSEMNLLGEALLPRLPARPTSTSFPRRVPPPPMSRRVIANDNVPMTSQLPSTPQKSVGMSTLALGTLTPTRINQSAAGSPSTNYQTLSPAKLSLPSLVPPPPPPRKTPSLAFSLTPLMPSNSPPPRNMPSLEKSPLKPLKPAKPQSLSAAKLEVNEVSTETETELKPRPLPPPARTATPKGMAEWKPLVPQ